MTAIPSYDVTNFIPPGETVSLNEQESELSVTDYVDEVSLTLPATATLDDCATLLNACMHRSAAYRWYIGDILWQSEARHGELASQLLPESEHSTLLVWQWTASKIPASLRDLSIPFTYYRDCASLDLPVIASLLADLKAEGWDRDQWRAAVAQAKGTVPRTAPKRDIAAACDYANSKVGEVWSASDAEAIREYLGYSE